MNKGITFDLKENNEGTWFDFFESRIDLDTGDIVYDDPISDTGRACFRPARPFLEKRLSKREKISEIVLNPKTRAMERIESYKVLTPAEERQEREDLIDYTFIGLEDFFEPDGAPIECTRENKIALVKNPVFDRFMARCMELQLNVNIKQAETSEKNSETP